MDGAVTSFTGSGGKIWVYKGTELLNPIPSGTPTTGEVRILNVSISGWIDGSIDLGSGDYFVVTGPTQWNNMNHSHASITFDIQLEGDTNEVSKRISYSLANDGADGADGADGSDGTDGSDGADGDGGDVGDGDCDVGGDDDVDDDAGDCGE